MKYGFLRVASAVPAVRVADCEANARSIIDLAGEAAAKGVAVAVFPELSVTAYTCGDLFHSSTLIEGAVRAVERIAADTAALDTAIIIGAPVSHDGSLYNAAIVIWHGDVLAAVPKTYLPNYNEFYEKRWFCPAPAERLSVDIGRFKGVTMATDIIFSAPGVGKFAVEICEDLWAPVTPSAFTALAGAEVIFNLSASDDLIGKYAYLRTLVEQQSARCLAGYVYAGAGYGESSTDLVFDGKALIAENGRMLAEAQRWTAKPSLTVADIDLDAINHDRIHSTTYADCRRRLIDRQPLTVTFGGVGSTPEGLLRPLSPTPFVPASDEHIAERCREIINIQAAGLVQRLDATRTRTITVGISGGLDSTLALLVAARAFDRLGLDRKDIIGVTMPGFGTTGRTYNNALQLMRSLGVTIREIPIADAVTLHFRDIGHNPAVTDVTYENSQARERTQILMDVANQTGGMVLGTGDLSELALGWATYNGDHMSMYGVNAGVPKTLVRYLVRQFAAEATDEAERAALLDIIDTPISPELTPASADGTIAQKTEDLVGPYELHDFFLYYMLRYGFLPSKIYYLACHAFPGRDEEIRKWIKVFFRRFFNQQFKRSCLPDGPKVGSVCLSPRGDWRMPSDASSTLWLADLDRL